jgi:hypothetical protein
MSAALKKIEIESSIAARFGDAFKVHEKTSGETLSTGVEEVDLLTGGLPRGALSEISGSSSSGRTSLVLSMLASTTTKAEVCALIDVHDVFSPTVAVNAGVDPDRLLWVRCNANLEQAFKATDLLLHAGGFGLVVLDMGDVPAKEARRIISSWWYRFRRTIENRPTALVVITETSCTNSCASLSLKLEGSSEWSDSGIHDSNVLPLSRSVPTPRVLSHANLLQLNSIKIVQTRPLWLGANKSTFSVGSLLCE